MTAIAERELVRAPLASANAFVQEYVAAHRAPKGNGARIILQAGEVAQAALITVDPAHRPEDMTPRYKVRWEAEAGGPYPVFDGELTIGSDVDYNAFWLVLDGDYAPPGGIAGQVFDAVIGRRIATACARGLLAEMRGDIEARFTAQEQAKKR